RPLLASPQAAPFFPLNWLGDVLDFWQSRAWVAFFKLFVAAIGTLVLCRRLGLSVPAGVLGGIAFALSLAEVFWLQHPQTSVFAVFPWMLWAGDRLAASGEFGDVLLLA